MIHQLRECECPACNREGRVQLTPYEGEAPEDATDLCPECHGTGKVTAAVVSEDAWERIGLD